MGYKLTMHVSMYFKKDAQDVSELLFLYQTDVSFAAKPKLTSDRHATNLLQPQRKTWK